MENGAEWRFFEGLERHFAVPGADGAKAQPASLHTHALYVVKSCGVQT